MKQKRTLFPILAALVIFGLFYGGILILNQNRNQQYQIDERNQVGESLNGRQAILESSLNLRLGLAYSMAAFASANQDRLDDTFNAYAQQLYELTPGVRSIQIAPDGVITYIYPLAGNEPAMGLNLSLHPERRDAFQRTVRRNALTLSGPFELVQGGLGLVGQIPILIEGSFWGVGVVVIDVPPLLVAAGLSETNGDNAFAVRRVDGEGTVYPTFIGTEALFAPQSNAVRTVIPLPDGYWELAASPTSGWKSAAPESTLILSSGLALALALSVAAFYVTRTNIDNRRLLVEELRQRQIAQSLQTVALDLNSDLDEKSLLHEILAQLALVVAYDSSGLFLRSDEALVLRQGMGFDEANLSTYRIPLAREQALEVMVFTQMTAYMVTDVRLYPDWHTWTTETAVGTWMGVPLLVDGQPIGVLTVHNKITALYTPDDQAILQAFAEQAAVALKNAQLLQETQTAREIAESANRAKSAFLAAMSHELRTPLNGVLGYAQILQNDPQLTPDQRRGLQVIERSGNHLLNLINEVLDLAKIEAGRLELDPAPFSLPTLLEDVGTFCVLRTEHKGLQFHTDYEKLPTAVRGDAKRLQQVLLNLLSNAIKFTETGEVWLRVTAVSQSTAVGGAAPHLPTIQLRFEVTDTGSGIPANSLNTIFEPFQQNGSLSQRSQGTGLGLSIARNLLMLMDSHLYVLSKTATGNWATTAPDMPPTPAITQGSRFWFYRY